MARCLPRVLILVCSCAPIYCLITFTVICVSRAESTVQVVNEANNSSSVTAREHPDSEVLGKEEIFRRIGILEGAVENAESKHASKQTIITISRNLGTLYSMVSMFPKAEAATIHAIQLMRS